MNNRHRAAVFLDRDGTLIEDVGVLKYPEDIRLFPDTVNTLQRLRERYLLFVITNQSGIARGEVSFEQVEKVNLHLDAMLRQQGIVVEKWYVCPHDRHDHCLCIKPNPTFLLQAAEEFGLSLTQSVVIGDHPNDVITGDTTGTLGLYVLTGHGQRHLHDVPNGKLVFHSLYETAVWIADHPGHELDLHRSVRDGADAIRRGGLVAFPTETVYGLGADAFNSNAVARIFEAKNRPLHDPLIIHVSAEEQVRSLVSELPKTAAVLMERFWPGPLTLVLPKSRQVPDIVTAGNPTVAVRMPGNPIALEMIRKAGTPVAAPSANRFGCTSPTTAKHVADQLDGYYDVLINGGACRVGIESTVLSLVDQSPVLLRPGGVSSEEIEAVIGPIRTFVEQEHQRLESPGLLPRHYAPQTPLIVFREIPKHFEGETDVGILLFEPSEIKFSGPVEILSARGSLSEAAGNLYAAIRRLDSLCLCKIITHRFPDHGLGKALNDRIKKASKE